MNTLLGADVRKRLIAIFALIVTLSATAHAQSYVEGISEVLSSTTSTDLYTFTNTYITYDLAAYYSPYTAAQLLDNGTQVAYGETGSPDGQNAPLDGHVPNLKTGDDYEVDGAHYLIQLYTYYDPGSGNTYYENPSYYDFTSGDQSSGYDYTGGGGAYYTVASSIFLGYTASAISTAVPQITGISPAGAAKGASGQTASGQITVSGSHLVDVFDGSTTPTVLSGSDFSLTTTGTPSATQVTLNYSITASATTGARQFTLSNRFGQSEPQTFTIGDPSPVVGDVEPHVWPAGSVALPLTITGSGFGIAPTITIAGVGVLNPVPAVTNSTDSSISTSVSIAMNAPNGPATVTVQSHGSGGNGFVQGTPGQLSLGTDAAAIQAFTAPPTINLLNGTTNSPTAGQLISLSLTPPSGLTITSQTWTLSNYNDVIGRYTASTSNGTITPVDLQATAQSDLSYYYVVPGRSETVSVSVTYDNLQSANATATFNVNGPTNANIVPTVGTVNILPAGVGFAGKATSTVIELGDGATKNGIRFDASATFPSGDQGAYSWVQLITSYTQTLCVGACSQTDSLGSGLDTNYPYPPSNGSIAVDSPGIGIIDSNSEVAARFHATMYALWAPTAANGCSIIGSLPCTIPIPLGSIGWTFTGDAINTLSTSTGATGTPWILNSCSSGNAGNFNAPNGSSGYPQWTNLFTNHN